VKAAWGEEELRRQSRRFNIDLVPRLLYSRGAMVELLISSNISRYTEFKAVTRVVTLINGLLEQVPSSRSDVFATRHISVIEKRILMKFLTACLQEAAPPCTGITFGELLRREKVSGNLSHFILHSIAMVEEGEQVEVGWASTRRFLSSLGRFGPTPFLWSMYGTGELPQAFCRLCAVYGGVYYLGRSLNGVVISSTPNTPNSTSPTSTSPNSTSPTSRAVAVVVGGKRVACSHLLLPAALVPAELREEGEASTSSRALLLSSSSLLPADKEQLTFLSLPKEGDRQTVQVVEVGPGACACPPGLHLLHASCRGPADLVALVEPLVGQGLVYSLAWQAEVLPGGATTRVSNLYSAAGPEPELDLDTSIARARAIYSSIYPGEEFLPRAPDPEEIILGGEEGDQEGEEKGEEKGEETGEEKSEEKSEEKGEAKVEEGKLDDSEEKEGKTEGTANQDEDGQKST